MIDYLKTLEIRKVVVGTALENTPSVALLSRLGFQLTTTEQISFYKDQKGQAIVFQGGIFEKGFEKKAEGVL